ncbi:hypothetical protein [Ferrimicrobium sp.]|uniref:hypothetical protein n=1 Tax=Ferrimicrobium sp. TaxID=2926050 RepID=UPI00262A8564|nr:hypothetical protein [Ferrimicrobium sp.]
MLSYSRTLDYGFAALQASGGADIHARDQGIDRDGLRDRCEGLSAEGIGSRVVGDAPRGVLFDGQMVMLGGIRGTSQ